MHAKYIIWLLVVASLFFAGCTKLSEYKNDTANISNNQAVDCLSNCTTTYTPVCGVNNKTYWNSCAAKCAGITVARQGDCTPVVKTCNDTEDGKDSAVKGTVTTSDNVSLTDKCLNASTVLEYYCSGSEISNKEIACENGFECKVGKCAEKEPPAPACNDSDDGRNATVRGTVTVGDDTLTDTCNGTASVKEYYCDGNESDSSLMDCPEGTACKSGKCSEVEASCEDTDGGQNLTRRGIVKVANATGTKNYTDDCYSEATVIEYYCDGDGMAMKKVTCPDGSTCVSGACAQNECDDSDDGKNATEKGTVTVGSDEFVDKCKDDTSVTEYYCSGSLEKSVTIECDSGDVCVSGACVGPCEETDDVDDIYDKGTTTQGEDEYTDKCKTASTLTEYYCEDNVIESKSASCPSDYTCLDGACQYKCTETDGGKDYPEPGTTTKGSDSEDDVCVDADTLREFYCYSNLIKNITTTCTCESGACTG